MADYIWPGLSLLAKNQKNFFKGEKGKEQPEIQLKKILKF
jgi:hypothetical protein